MSAQDIATILEAVGDSWPAALVLLALAACFIVWRLSPRLARMDRELGAVKHEMQPNSGKTLRDAVNRMEKLLNAQAVKLDEHIAEARERDTEDLLWKNQVEDLLTAGEGYPPRPTRETP